MFGELTLLKLQKRHYVLQTEPGMESRVKKEIGKRKKIKNMEHHIGKVLIPRTQERRYDEKTGEPRIVNKVRYPGYLIFEAAFTADVFVLIRGVKGVLGFLPYLDRELLNKEELEELKEMGDMVVPTPLKDEEAAMALLQSRKVTTEEAFPKPVFKAGQEVIIAAGRYAGVAGTVKAVNQGSTYDIEILVLGQKTKIKALSQWQIQGGGTKPPEISVEEADQEITDKVENTYWKKLKEKAKVYFENIPAKDAKPGDTIIYAKHVHSKDPLRMIVTEIKKNRKVVILFGRNEAEGTNLKLEYPKDMDIKKETPEPVEPEVEEETLSDFFS